MSDLCVLCVRTGEGPEPDFRGAIAAIAAGGGVWCGIDRGVAVARFDPDDTFGALAGALHALEAIDLSGELDVRARGALAVGDAIVVAASGDLDDVGPGILLGETVDRARTLAEKARPGELVLDRTLHDAVEAEIIVARRLTAGGRRAYGLDRRVALRAQAMETARGLTVPGLVGLETTLDHARTVLAPTPSWIRIAAAPGDGGSALVDAVLSMLPGAVVLEAGVGSSEPLGAVAAALRGRLGDAGIGDLAVTRVAAEARVLARRLPPELAESLRRAAPVVGDLVEGRLRPVAAVAEALGAYASALQSVGLPPVVTAEVEMLDPESAEVLRRLHDAGAPLRIVLLGEGDADLPRMTAIEPPEWSDGRARSLAAAMLGVSARASWLDRVVARGARCPRGTLDAVRDAVEEGCMTPGGGLAPRPLKAPPRRPAVERVLARRIERLSTAEKNVLYAAAMLGDRSAPSVLEFVCVSFGLGHEEVDEAVSALEARGHLVRHVGRARIAGRRARTIVRGMVPVDLRRKLHRAAAEAITILYPGARTFAVLSHLAKAGDRAVVASRTLEAAQEALEAGLPWAALRALDFDPNPTEPETQFQYAEVRERAAAQLGDGEGRMVALAEMQALARAAEEPAWLARVAARNAEAALAGREVQEAERWAAMAVAAGGSKSVADRIHALADLAQGDPSAAIQLFHRAAERDLAAGRGDAAVRARLGAAIAELARGEGRAAVRGALEVLAQARRRRDRRAEWFGLWVLAEACTRAGLTDVAARLAEAAGPGPG